MKILTQIRKIRGSINRHIVPRRLKPLSTKFGYDRGTPIDRYWIEDFLNRNRSYIKGRVLEITDDAYTVRFGEQRVKISDVLDIDTSNNKANIHGDLRNLKNIIKDNTYDCIILTHVLGLIDDYGAAIKEMKRILKPGGVIIYTGSCLGPILGEKVFWRFTPNSVRYIFEKEFKPKSIYLTAYGNVLAGQGFWVGMAQEDLTNKELSYRDEKFPCVVAAVIKKGKAKK